MTPADGQERTEKRDEQQQQSSVASAGSAMGNDAGATRFGAAPSVGEAPEMSEPEHWYRAKFKTHPDTWMASKIAFDLMAEYTSSVNAAFQKTNRELNRRNQELQHTLNVESGRKAWYGYYLAFIQLIGMIEKDRKAAEAERDRLQEELRRERLRNLR